MQRRALGATGMTVSAIGLGAWQLRRSEAWPEGPEPAEAERLVAAALDAGVSLFDTAPGYAGGESERTLGRALGSAHGAAAVVCTKFGHRPDGTTDWDVRSLPAMVAESARRLRRERVDVVLLHNPPPDILAGRQGHYEALARMRQTGLVGAYGASVDTAAEVDAALASMGAQVLEVRLSALYQEPWEAVARAHERGVGVLVKVPLESGWLGGRYGPDTVFSGVRARWSREDIRERAALVAEFGALLPAGMATATGAIAFLHSHPGVSSVLAGMRTPDHLREATRAADERLPDAVARAVRAWYGRRLGHRALAW